MKLPDNTLNWLIPLIIALVGWLAWISYDYGTLNIFTKTKFKEITEKIEEIEEWCCPTPEEVKEKDKP